MRDKIIGAIATRLKPLHAVLALWQGGSAAQGYTDEWSDIDLQVIVEDDAVEATFEQAEAALAMIAPVCFKYRMPEPTWHGHAQAFYQLQGMSPYLMIDFVVLQHSNPNRFIEVERHGSIVVYFDKANLLIAPPLDWTQHYATMRQRLEHLKQTFDFLQVFVKKEVQRERFCEAVMGYYNRTLPPLIELLGMVYRPHRYDFKKYISRDFPPDVLSRLELLHSIADLADLTQKQQEAEAWFHTALPHAEEVVQAGEPYELSTG